MSREVVKWEKAAAAMNALLLALEAVALTPSEAAKERALYVARQKVADLNEHLGYEP